MWKDRKQLPRKLVLAKRVSLRWRASECIGHNPYVPKMGLNKPRNFKPCALQVSFLYHSHTPPVLRSLKDTVIQSSTYLLNSAFMFRGPSRSLFTDLSALIVFYLRILVEALVTEVFAVHRFLLYMLVWSSLEGSWVSVALVFWVAPCIWPNERAWNIPRPHAEVLEPYRSWGWLKILRTFLINRKHEHLKSPGNYFGHLFPVS